MGNVNFNEEFKDKWLKISFGITLLVILCVIIILTIVTVVKINKGEHVRVFGMEYNIPKDHPDTIVQRILQKPDTIVKFKPSISARMPSILNPKKSSFEVKTSIDTSKKGVYPIIQAKNVNAGTNLGNVGDNAHSVIGNNFGINGDVNINKERQLAEDEKVALMDFIESVKIKNNFDPKCFTIIIVNNSNGNKIATQIESLLKKNGYTMNGAYGYAIRNPPVKGIEIGKGKGNNCLEIFIGTIE